MPALKLVYFEGCPNTERAKQSLKRLGHPFELVRQDDLPQGHPLRGYTSPTVLSGDRVVFGAQSGHAAGGCSLGVPSADELSRALEKMGHQAMAPRKSMILSTIGSWGSALTVGLCPVCIPAIGALLSSIGLGFLVNETVLRPLLVGFIASSWFGFGWSYFRERGSPYPGVLGVLAGLGLYVGRYAYLGGTWNAVLMYGGVAAMITASVWNLALRRKSRKAGEFCPACVGGGGR